MFTGIIQDVGIIESGDATNAGREFRLRSRATTERLSIGDSVSINGVCQTVEVIANDCFAVTAVGETLRRTTFGMIEAGERVNLECAATLQTALGGHLVQGHVDGVGTIESFIENGSDRIFAVELPDEAYVLSVEKGSITIDGISLTIAERKPRNVITIAIVPHTLQNTIASEYEPGRRVNVEADIIGKYTYEYLQRMKSNR